MAHDQQHHNNTPFYAVVGTGDLVVEKIRRLRSLPENVQGRAFTAVDEAGELYAGLVSRGSRLVTRIRNQESTGRLERQAEQTVNQAKAAANATRRTATTAKRTASTAKSRTKATASAAKRTAAHATRAAVDAVGKVGN